MPAPRPTPTFAAVIRFEALAVGVCCDTERLRELILLPPDTSAQPATSALAQRAVDQLLRWQHDPEHHFELPLTELGTPFQRQVWRAIAAIPCGRTRRYGDIAAELASAARAVGQACGANPFPIIVPCHRVLSASGSGGFAHARDGWLLDAKRWLLTREGLR